MSDELKMDNTSKTSNNLMIIFLLQAFISIWAIESLVNVGAQNIVGLVLVAALYLLYKKENDISKGYNRKMSFVISAFFSFLYTFYNCNELRSQYDNRLFQVIVLLVVFMGIFFSFLSCSECSIYVVSFR